MGRRSSLRSETARRISKAGRYPYPDRRGIPSLVRDFSNRIRSRLPPGRDFATQSCTCRVRIIGETRATGRRVPTRERSIMETGGTITRCMRDLEESDRPRRDDAARELWEYFFADLACYARKRLRAMHAPTGPADEEDAADRAFTKVCRAMEPGRLKLEHRVDLHRVLRSATAREVLNLTHQAKRAAGHDERRIRPEPDPRHVPPAGAAPAGPRRLPAAAQPAGRRCAAAGRALEARRLHQRGDPRQARLLAGHRRACPGSRIRETWKREWADAVPDRPAKSGPRTPSAEGSDEFDVQTSMRPRPKKRPAGSSAAWRTSADGAVAAAAFHGSCRPSRRIV